MKTNLYSSALILCLGVLLLFQTVVFSQPLPKSSKIPLEQRLYGLSSFWSAVKYHFAFFDQVPDLNWDRAYLEYVQKVMEAEDDLEYFRTMQLMAAELKESHTYISSPRNLRSDLNATPPYNWIELKKRRLLLML